ncbi:hypothetical protein TNCV_3466151 [Trichonephila clavipes]|nr:hypothetical protein TNCV_3466151 [Trichonephila clavipes]
MRSTTSVRHTLLHPKVTYPHYSCLVSSNTTTDFPEDNPQSRFDSDHYRRSSSLWGSRGSRVVKVSDHGWPCHDFKPITTKDPPCRAAMHALNLSRAQRSSRWCGVVDRERCQVRRRPGHLTMVQNYVDRRQKPSCSWNTVRS